MSTWNAPIGPVQLSPSQGRLAAGGDADWNAIPCLTVEHFKRAFNLLATALPDTTGAAVGIVHAMYHRVSPDCSRAAIMQMLLAPVRFQLPVSLLI